MFYLQYKSNHPYFQISWSGWKIDNIYDRMASFISLNKKIKPKNKKQCKSADQRYKKIYFL
jgi:hypothetical protein